jgi:ubiquinone/menaquinone biosynthesis C-methylase UbiE
VTAGTIELVADEAAFLARQVPLAGARLVELGCGKAELARRLLQRGLVASVTALEVDRRQHAENLRSPHPEQLRFLEGGADAIPLPDACCEAVIMLKSLHHVPIPRMDAAFAEMRRILAPGGWVYLSEPVYAGDFNDIVKLFHDEGAVRAAAHEATRRCAQQGVLHWEAEMFFDTPLHFRDFDDFVARMVGVTHSDIRLPEAVRPEVERRFSRFMQADGARFVRRMRINLLRRVPAA